MVLLGGCNVVARWWLGVAMLLLGFALVLLGFAMVLLSSYYGVARWLLWFC